jgi:alkylation response protein AidB-like acyl-CoA dehydrogenase
VVSIAKEMPGIPVKLIWSREEDMLHGAYHPTTQCKLTGVLDGENNLTALHMRISGQSILAAVRPDGMQNGKDPVVFQGLNPPGPEASILKIKGSEIQQALSELMMQALGHYALPYVPEAMEYGYNEAPIGPDYAATLGANYFNMRKTSIYGGTNEIQRNIIAKMVLEL